MWRLSNLYVVDMLTRIEERRLDFVATSMVTAHNRRIQPSHELSEDGGDHAEDPGNVHASLPSSFVGSKAYRAEQVGDALELARRFGRPHGMLTLTTNPQWPELTEALLPGQTATDVPHLTVRVFRARLSRVTALFKKEYGPPKYMIRVIEFQKRGLPHAHMVFALDPECPVSCIDKIASAEVPPATQPRLRELVLRFMVHSDEHLIRANGEPNTSSRCFRDGKCIYGFPQPLAEHTTVDPASHRLIYRRRNEGDRMIAQYSPAILLAWEGHAHIDFALSLDTFVYIFKYINKGPDYCEFRVRPNDEPNADPYEDAALAAADEFQRARYISATEATWRLFGFPLCSKEPTVDRLGVHMPGENTAQFRGRNRVGSDASKLIRYFLRPPSYAQLTYSAYWETVTSISATAAQLRGDAPLPIGGALERVEAGMAFKPNVIRTRQRGTCIARIKSVRPGAGEVFYLRQLLLHRPAASWKDLRTTGAGTPNRVLHATFQAAAVELGLFEHGSEALLALRDAVDLFQPPSELRFLFAILVLDGAIASRLWDEFRLQLSRDFLPRALGAAPSALETQQGCEAALRAIASILEDMGCDPVAHGLPRSQERPAEVQAELEFFRPRRRELRVAADHARGAFNAEQATLYAALLGAATTEGEDRLHLIQGKAGRGKTFVIHAIVNHFRALETVVGVAGATGLCASAFERGSTAHRLFGIPVKDSDDGLPLTSTVTLDGRRAAYLRECQFLIIDEIWALHRSVIEAVDELMQKIMQADTPFGGKPVIAIGDPRQTAPIVRGGGKADVLANSFRASPLFQLFQLHELHQPIRTGADPAFSQWVDSVGEDATSSDIDLSAFFRCTTSLAEVRHFLFPIEVLENATVSSRRAFLSPYNVDVAEFNKNVLDSLPGRPAAYTSFDHLKGEDSLAEDDVPLASPEVLHELLASGIPAHEIELKVGAMILIMRNLSAEKGLVKNAKAVVLKTSARVVVIRLLETRQSFTLPRITFEFQPTGFPFTVVRKQIPVRLAYALTFNGCQGATLDRAVVDGRLPIFAHGQRYASVSRCRNSVDCLALLPGETAEAPTPAIVNNIVYPELVAAHEAA
ncbi:hypothetical protein CF326_g8209 [Tilletia indica]|nr:hypothetical protein CF326_g8209 [Tilletia indica]